ncbi:hypothetical protein Leryth_003656 [Lithospermum erythrorhizon]|nr:hypothetical protein Leryth_003656 [Lithospermum erythrorhizon]
MDTNRIVLNYLGSNSTNRYSNSRPYESMQNWRLWGISRIPNRWVYWRLFQSFRITGLFEDMERVR